MKHAALSYLEERTLCCVCRHCRAAAMQLGIGVLK